MHNFVPNIYWATVLFERELDDFDRAIHASAETARCGEQYGQGRFVEILFSHWQCHIISEGAKAKDFRGICKERCRDGNWPIKEINSGLRQTVLRK